MGSLVGLGSALSAFFDGDDRDLKPSHDEITNAIKQHDLTDGDPAGPAAAPVGKTKRVRAVLTHAHNHAPAAGLALALTLVSLLQVHGRFERDGPDHAGDRRIDALRRALETFGYVLDSAGGAHLVVIDNLHGTELTLALERYVNRINLNPDDDPLLLGTSKDLAEATARHVAVERQGEYAASANYPATLHSAFRSIGLHADVPSAVEKGLSAEPAERVDQCLFLLALAVNKLRHQEGTGHGRPQQPSIDAARARAVARGSAMVAGAMLDALGATTEREAWSQRPAPS